MLVTPGAYPRRKHLKGAPIGLALALLSNSKTDWKVFPRTNTLAYKASSSATKEESFITDTRKSQTTDNEDDDKVPVLLRHDFSSTVISSNDSSPTFK